MESVSVDDGVVTIEGEAFRHLHKVLRLKRGDAVRVFNGRGVELHGRIGAISGGVAVVDVEGVVEAPDSSPLDIFLLQGLLKGGKMDLVVRKATELGVSSILPFFTERTVPRFDGGAAARKTDRWRKIAEEASRQCGRGMVPAVYELLPYEEAARVEGIGDGDIKIICCADGVGLKRFLMDKGGNLKGKRVVVLAGPEGGFSEGEIKKAHIGGFTGIHLGPRILRAETASIAVISLLQYELGDMGFIDPLQK